MSSQINSYMLLLQKGGFILGAIFYLIFALIIVKQVSTMSKNINDKFNALLITFSYIHLIFSIILVFLTIVIL